MECPPVVIFWTNARIQLLRRRVDDRSGISEQIVIGIYSSFKNSALYSGTLTLAPDVQTDLVYAVKGYTNVYGPLYRWDFRDSDTSIESVYSGLYQVIVRCNFFMDHKDEVYGKLTTK